MPKNESSTEVENKLTSLEILKQLRVVIRAAQQHSLWIEKQCGVNGAQLWLLQELYEENDLRVGELAHRLAVHQTTTSNLIDALDKRALVKKTRDPNDQRAVRVSLTEDGIALLLKAPKPARGLLPEALRNLNETDLSHLHIGLKGLIQSIEVVDEGFENLPLPFTM
jgi:DNA-binding MarR family transcriptional regulator